MFQAEYAATMIANLPLIRMRGVFEHDSAALRQHHRTARGVVDSHQAIDDRIFPHRKTRAGAAPRRHGFRIGAGAIRRPRRETAS